MLHVFKLVFDKRNFASLIGHTFTINLERINVNLSIASGCQIVKMAFIKTSIYTRVVPNTFFYI